MPLWGRLAAAFLGHGRRKAKCCLLLLSTAEMSFNFLAALQHANKQQQQTRTMRCVSDVFAVIPIRHKYTGLHWYSLYVVLQKSCLTKYVVR